MWLIGRDWYSLSPACWTLFRVALIETRGFCEVDDFVATPAAVSASVGSAQPSRVAGGTVEFFGWLERLGPALRSAHGRGRGAGRDFWGRPLLASGLRPHA